MFLQTLISISVKNELIENFIVEINFEFYSIFKAKFPFNFSNDKFDEFQNKSYFCDHFELFSTFKIQFYEIMMLLMKVVLQI